WRTNSSVMFARFRQLCRGSRPAATGQRNADDGSASTGARRVALACKHLERCHNCAARYAQFGCQGARGGQASPGVKPPGQNLGANPLINLTINGETAPGRRVLSLHGPFKFTNVGPSV